MGEVVFSRRPPPIVGGVQPEISMFYVAIAAWRRPLYIVYNMRHLISLQRANKSFRLYCLIFVCYGPLPHRLPMLLQTRLTHPHPRTIFPATREGQGSIMAHVRNPSHNSGLAKASKISATAPVGEGRW